MRPTIAGPGAIARRRLSPALLVPGVLLGLTLMLPAPARAADFDESLVTVESPRLDHLFQSRPARVPVRLRVRPGVRVHATLKHHSVRLGPKRGGVLTGRVVVRGSGPADLRVRAHRRGTVDVDVVRVFLGHEIRGLVSAAVPPRVSGTAPARVRLRRPGYRLLVSLNGRPVRGMFASPPGSRLRRNRLSASEGLRFGRNRLRVVAFARDGRYTRAVRSFVVSRARPLAATGGDRHVRRGHSILLSAGHSRATRSGGRLAYRWRLIGRPHGSQARLRHAARAKPSLRPDRYGRYGLRLSVREASRGSSHRSKGNRVAIDSQRLVAFPTDPMGLRLVVETGGIVIGAEPTSSDPTPAGAWYRNQGGPATVQLLTFDRATADMLSNQSFTRDKTGIGKLESAIKDVKSGKLVVVAASPAQPAIASDAVDSLNDALGDIGAPALSKTLLASQAGFSVVGVRGIQKGGAYVDPNVPPPPGDPAAVGFDGAISGWLQPYEPQVGGSKVLTFVPSDYEQFDTGGDNGAGQATITIGDNAYTGSLPPGQAGFLVVTLAGGTASSQVYRTNGGGNDLDDQASLGAKLLFVAPDPDQLVFMQSIGKPKPTTVSWANIGDGIAQLKGDPTTVNTLDGKTDYAFVGGSGVDHAAQATSATGLPGRLSGVLGRSRSFHVQPLLSDTSGIPDYSLLPIVFRAPNPGGWPTPGGPSVLKYVSNQLTKDNKNPDDDIRVEYDGSMEDFKTDLTNVSCAGQPDEADCNALKDELDTEFGWVDDVHDLTGGMQSALLTATSVQSTALLPQAQQAVSQSLAVPDSGALGTVIDYIADIVNLISVIPTPTEPSGGGAPMVGSPVPPQPEEKDSGTMGVLAAVLQLAGDTATDASGNPLVGQIQAKASQLDQQLGKNLGDLHDQIDQIDQILVADYGKLKAVGSESDAGEPFQWGSDVDQAALGQLTQAALEWFYGSLLPIGYTVDELTPGEHNSAGQSTDTYQCRREKNDEFVLIHPYRGTPPSAQFPYVTALNPDGSPKTPTVWTLAKTDPSGVYDGNLAPSGALANILFGAPDAQPPGLGLHASFFLPRYLKEVPQNC